MDVMLICQTVGVALTRLNPCVALCSTDLILWALFTLKGRRVPWLRDMGFVPPANPNEL
jgi:hypothetical protein